MAHVPCNGCRACCLSDLIILHEELGDDPETYKCHGELVGGRIIFFLDRKFNGECVYLDEHGCTIHDRAPAVCKEFDCRLFFRATSRPERRRLIKEGLVTKAVFEAGRKRGGSKTEEQR